jgi:hypothetical protein
LFSEKIEIQIHVLNNGMSNKTTITTQQPFRKPQTTDKMSSKYQIQQKQQPKPKMQTQNKNQSKFCRVCMNAGKTETQYRSHFTKNDAGIVLCPTILNAICSYCKAQGHFKGECPVLKTKNDLKSLKIIIPTNHEIEISEKRQIKKTLANNCTKTSYMKAVMQELFESSDCDSDEDECLPKPALVRQSHVEFLSRKRRNIMHDWADDEYWSDSNEEFK